MHVFPSPHQIREQETKAIYNKEINMNKYVLYVCVFVFIYFPNATTGVLVSASLRVKERTTYAPAPDLPSIPSYAL